MIDARHHQLTLTLPDEQVQVIGDANRLVQILTNLLNNSAKYTPEGGQLRLVMEADASQVLVAVSDNGIGIAPALHTQVFELFSQAERTSDRAQGGLGLGLALVKSLVELHGGNVRCLSGGADQGSTFEVRLPRYGVDAATTIAAAPAAVAQHGQERIMVVDDNEDAALMLGMLLEASGHAVTVAHRPLEAIALAQQAPPSVCILDIGLPDMDGYQLARRLRALPGMDSALLIAVTGYGQQNDRAKALDAGFDQHLVKPVEADRLLQLVGARRAM